MYGALVLAIGLLSACAFSSFSSLTHLILTWWLECPKKVKAAKTIENTFGNLQDITSVTFYQSK